MLIRSRNLSRQVGLNSMAMPVEHSSVGMAITLNFEGITMNSRGKAAKQKRLMGALKNLNFRSRSGKRRLQGTVKLAGQLDCSAKSAAY
jgi:hypothetical protein